MQPTPPTTPTGTLRQTPQAVPRQSQSGHYSTHIVMSNAERQRRFRKAHPGYHKRYYKSAAQHKAEQALLRIHEAIKREMNDPQLLLFPGERPAIGEAA